MKDVSKPPPLAKVRSAARGAGGLWPARRRLGAALRGLLEELDRVGPDDETIDAAATSIDRMTRELTPAAGEEPEEAGALPIAGMAHFQDRSPIVGLTNPIAPPFEFEVDHAAHKVTARGTFGRRHEGAPGLVHGGLLAATVDELLGMATIFSGAPGMTGTLTMSFLRPTPIGVELLIEGRMDGFERRKIRVSADVWAGEHKTAHADGIFVQVGTAKFEQFEQARRRR